jgi:hypothetical protein
MPDATATQHQVMRGGWMKERGVMEHGQRQFQRQLLSGTQGSGRMLEEEEEEEVVVQGGGGGGSALAWFFLDLGEKEGLCGRLGECGDGLV